MKAALWTKLKVVGPILGLDDEIRRFKLWLPPAFHPGLKMLFQWMEQHRKATDVGDRIEIEKQAIQELSQYSLKLPEQVLFKEFFQRVEYARANSLKTRQSVLEGELLDIAKDDTEIDGMLSWLATFSYSPQKEFANWLSRIIMAWRLEKSGL